MQEVEENKDSARKRVNNKLKLTKVQLMFLFII